MIGLYRLPLIDHHPSDEDLSPGTPARSMNGHSFIHRGRPSRWTTQWESGRLGVVLAAPINPGGELCNQRGLLGFVRGAWPRHLAKIVIGFAIPGENLNDVGIL